MMRSGGWCVCIGLALAGCAGDSSSAERRGNIGSACQTGETADCDCAGGASGTQRCQAGAWSSCACTEPGMDFGNTSEQIDAGFVFDGGLLGEPPANCDPGLYLGTYECELVSFGIPSQLAGDVAFNLEVNEQQVECEPGQEFCADLVISEGSGVLFGIAVGWGFEAPLKGGLDCQTGEFRTEPFEGVYGSAVSSDPNDPDALWTVLQPPVGMFGGELAGRHLGGDPQVIEGQWSLHEEGFADCTGGFTTQLQP